MTKNQMKDAYITESWIGNVYIQGDVVYITKSWIGNMYIQRDIVFITR